MPSTITPEPKNSDSSVTNENKFPSGSDVTWDDATYTWDEATGTWNVPGAGVSREAKNSDSTITLETKN